MLFINVFENTETNKSFYACFAFLKKIIIKDYVWAFRYLAAVFKSLRLPLLPVFISNMKAALFPVIAEVFSL